MRPRPDFHPLFPGVGRLAGEVALITGGDSGIGRAVAVAMAREGAKIAISYLDEDRDAEETRTLVEQEASEAILIKGDIGDEDFCRHAVEETVGRFSRLDILVNNAGEQHETHDIAAMPAAQIERTFRTNVFAMFYLVKAAVPHMREGGAIVNTASITAFRGHKTLIDYSATKGAIVALTRSLSMALLDKGIRVNAVAPGPIWTPLIPASFDAEEVKSFGENAPMHRAGQPNEVAPCYVFLASREASFMTGQVLHPNGGSIVA